MRTDNNGGKNGVHEEGMSFGSRPSKSKDDEWVSEDFGKPAEGSPKPNRVNKKELKKNKTKNRK